MPQYWCQLRPQQVSHFTIYNNLLRQSSDRAAPFFTEDLTLTALGMEVLQQLMLVDIGAELVLDICHFLKQGRVSSSMDPVATRGLSIGDRVGKGLVVS